MSNAYFECIQYGQVKHSVGDYYNRHTVKGLTVKFAIFTVSLSGSNLEIEFMSIACMEHLEVQTIHNQTSQT